jgi:hypothetical protein
LFIALRGLGFESFFWMISATWLHPIGFASTSSALQQNGAHGLLHRRVAALHECYCLRVCVTHGADDSESISRIRHVEVRDQRIEMLRGNKFQCFVYCRGKYDFKSPTLQPFLENGQDVFVIIN